VPGRFRIARGRDETLIDLDAEPGSDLPPSSGRTGFGGTHGTDEGLFEPPVPESTGQGHRGPAP
jgi:hypothetical protein